MFNPKFSYSWSTDLDLLYYIRDRKLYCTKVQAVRVRDGDTIYDIEFSRFL